VGYAEGQYSELAFARELSEHIGTRHHEVVLGQEEFFASLPKLIWHEDEPITWPSSIPLYFLSRLAAGRVKVVLTGEGSDELFGGYARYRHFLAGTSAANAYGRLPSALRRGLRSFIADSPLFSADLRRQLQHTILGRETGIESMYLDNYYCAFSVAELQDLMPKSNVTSAQVYGSFLGSYAASDSSSLGRLLFADQQTYLAELLRKQDRMSMAASIESRVPFLDHRLVEYAATVDAGLKISGKEGKHVLKRAVEELLPKQLIYRKKMGFPTPLKDWLRQGQSAISMTRQLQRKDGLLSDCLDGRVLSRLIERHERGQIDATDRIWRLLNLQIWGDIFLTGRAPEEVRLSS
jgi:asparagine synthase (glutamine-hydrolysing)